MTCVIYTFCPRSTALLNDYEQVTDSYDFLDLCKLLYCNVWYLQVVVTLVYGDLMVVVGKIDQLCVINHLGSLDNIQDESYYKSSCLTHQDKKMYIMTVGLPITVHYDDNPLIHCQTPFCYVVPCV